LVGLEVIEGGDNRFFHGPAGTARNAQPTSPTHTADLDPMEGNHVAVGYRGRVDSAWFQWILADEVVPAFLRYTHVVFLHRFGVNVREGCLVILKGTHLLELFFYAPASF